MFVGVIAAIASLILATAASQLKEKQDYNIELDRKKNVLSCLGSSVKIDGLSNEDIISEYTKRIKEIFITLGGDTINNFSPNQLIVEVNSVSGMTDYYCPILKDTLECLPIYSASSPKASIMPITGKGLWSTLYGYIALEEDHNTIKGLTFYKHKETAGLGGEIEKLWFKDQFKNKKIFDNNNNFVSIKVLKGISSENNKHAVNGISGATVTSRGVMNLLYRDLSRYLPFINKITNYE